MTWSAWRGWCVSTTTFCLRCWSTWTHGCLQCQGAWTSSSTRRHRTRGSRNWSAQSSGKHWLQFLSILHRSERESALPNPPKNTFTLDFTLQTVIFLQFLSPFNSDLSWNDFGFYQLLIETLPQSSTIFQSS